MRQPRTKYAYRKFTSIAVLLGIGATAVALAYHSLRTRLSVVTSMDTYSRNPALTLETYYRLIDHWRNEHNPVFQFTCPERYKLAILDYCARFQLTCMTRVAESSLYQKQTTFLVSKNTTVSYRP